MRDNLKFFKNSKTKPIDKFFQTVLYDNKIGYYNSNFLSEVQETLLLLQKFLACFQK